MTRPIVMVVDDEAPLLRAMSRVLSREFEVVPASGPTDALAAFSARVQVVLTDFSMPDGDGLSLTRALRARGFTGPVVMLSAIVECADLQAALETKEVTELIPKPWTGAELVRRVAQLCAAQPPGGSDPAGLRQPA